MSSSAVAPVAFGDARTPPERPAGVRPRLSAEVLLIAVCYSAYSLVRDLVPANHMRAIRLGHRILRIEHDAHMDVELSVNRFLTHAHWAGVIANYYYSTLHFIVTPGVLAWLYVRHPDRYVFFRRLIFSTTVLALAGFWLFPLAPPRMLPGFVDTVLSFHTEGLYPSGGSPIGAISNEYAAMPSLHTGWSLWCAIVIIAVARARWAKALAVCYPALTVIVILGTANHYVLDAVGGMLTLGAGYLATLGVRTAIPRLGSAARFFSRD